MARVLCATAIALSALVADLPAQVIRRVPRAQVLQVKPGDQPNDETAENVFLPADRDTLKRLTDAKSLLAESRYGEAVRNLGALLDGAEDFFFQPDKQSPMHRSLKAEAQRLIGELPRDGRELYELQYGARARQMLEEGLATGDVARLAEVSRRFFHTKAGRQASFLTGLDHFNNGRSLAGALVLQRLRDVGHNATQSVDEFEPTLSLTLATCWLQSDMPKKAAQALVTLRERHPNMRLDVGGRQVTWFTKNSDPLDWLLGLIGPQAVVARKETDEWLMFRGDAARNVAAAGGTPLMNLRWHVSATEEPMTESALEQQQKEYAEQGVVSLPALHPLVVGDVLLMRTLNNLLAVDFLTGKRLWEVPVDEPVESVAGDSAVQQAAAISSAGQRAWNDLTFGTLSSDGRLVFSVEDLKSDANVGDQRGFAVRRGMFLVRNMHGEPSGLSNRLAAHDIRTGKLIWHLGGNSGPHALRLAETFFLGPPLPLMGQLYVLGETKGEIRLMALDVASGDLIWSQQLALAEQSVAQDPMRRCSGASPSYSEGVLVCPTANGAIVAVELATRSLLWGYCYSQDRGNRRVTNGLNFPMTSAASDPNATRWADASVTISEGRVLATPIESDWLYCLNLLDGKVLWKVPRQNDNYVACVDREHVMVVGRNAIRALNLSDGTPAWGGRVVQLPESSIPSGRGFLSNKFYYLPLSSAEVAEIDLAAGTIVRAAKARNGGVPGNLVCHRGSVISQAAHGVDSYYQLDAVHASVEKRLAANPDDAEALSLRGEVQLDSGQRTEAIASFRRAYQLAPEQRTRELLRESLLEGLRSDFATYRQNVSEVERLVDDPSQKAALLRVLVDGLQRSGELLAAFECCEKLIDLEPGAPPFDQVDKTYSARRDRWVQAHLIELHRAAKGEVADKIDRAVLARINTAREAKSLDALRRGLGYFGELPVAASARAELVERLRGEGKLLEAELASATRPTAPADADNAKPWPVGKVDMVLTPTKSVRTNAYGRSAVELNGPTGPFMSDISLQFDNSRRTLIAYDGWGQERWQVPLTEGASTQESFYSAGLPQAFVEGHLLLLAQGAKLVAVDTSAANAKAGPRVVWSQDMSTPKINSMRRVRVALPQVLPALQWRLQAQLGVLRAPSSLLTRRYVCFQRFHNLVAVDPSNGETLWMRQDLPLNCMLFGDEQYVLAFPPDRDEALLLRATDGETLGTRKIPRIARRPIRTENGSVFFGRLDDSCLASLGHKLLLWWPDGNRRVLTLIDPVEGRDEWTEARNFAGRARVAVLNEEVVGVMEPDGRFVLISLPDGRTIADLQLEAEPNLAEIFLLSSKGQYFLITHRPALSGRQPTLQPIPGCAVKPIHRGHLYALDAQGKLQWPNPVEIRNQGLLLNQPALLPVLTFINQTYAQKPNGEGRSAASVLCVDKRNGRTVYAATFSNPTSMFQVTGDAQKSVVNLILQQKTVTLTFTNAAMPAAPGDAGKAKAAGNKAARALWDSIEQILGGAGNGNSEEDDDP